jgi:hypothetical protein
MDRTQTRILRCGACCGTGSLGTWWVTLQQLEAQDHAIFAVLQQTRREVVRNPPPRVSKREAAAWWSENVARIARDLHRRHLPKAPLRQTFQALAAPRPGQRKVAPVADRWVEAMEWAEVLLGQAAAVWEEPETRSSWERWRSLGQDQEEAEPLGDLLGVPDVLPIGSLSDSDRDDLAALALRQPPKLPEPALEVLDLLDISVEVSCVPPRRPENGRAGP